MPSSSGLSPKPKQKPRLIPRPDGVALAVKDKGKFELIPQLGSQFELNGKKCSKAIQLKRGDVVTVRKHLTFKVNPKTRDAKLFCNIPTPEVLELKQEKERITAELQEEKDNVNKLHEELEAEKARLEEMAAKTRDEIKRLDEEKRRNEEENKQKLALMEAEARKRMDALDEEMRQKELEVKKQLAKLDLAKKQHEEDMERMSEEQKRAAAEQEAAMREAEAKHKAALAGSAEERERVERKMKLRENQLQALERVLESAQHGESDVTIKDVYQIMADVMGTSSAKDRKNMVFATVLKADNLKNMDWVEQHAPYVQMIAGGKSCKTVQVKDTLSPMWTNGSTFFFRVTDDEDIQFKAFETDAWSSEDLLIGHQTVPVKELKANERVHQTVVLEEGDEGKLEVEFLYCVWSD